MKMRAAVLLPPSYASSDKRYPTTARFTASVQLARIAALGRAMAEGAQRRRIAQAGREGKPHGRPPTVQRHAGKVRALHIAGMSMSEIARRLQVSRTSIRRLLGASAFNNLPFHEVTSGLLARAQHTMALRES